MVRGRLSYAAYRVVACSLFSLRRNGVRRARQQLVFGGVRNAAVRCSGWTSAYSTIQAAAQLVCPPWVRARSLSIYQLAQNGALTIGSFAWGWIGGEIGLHDTLLAASGVGIVLMLLARYAPIETIAPTPVLGNPDRPQGPEAPAAELVGLLRDARGRVMETVHYLVAPDQRPAFLKLMREARHVRGRAGALFWQVYEDVAHPEGWLEVWSMENWTDHLREVTRLSEEDKQLLARLSIFQVATERPQRYLAVDPHGAANVVARAPA